MKGLSSLKDGPQSILLVNRTEDNARAVADAIADERIAVHEWNSLRSVIADANVTIFAAEVTEPLVSGDDLAEGSTLLIDLGMPRCVDVSVDAKPGVRRLDIAHLETVVQATLAERHAELDAAEGIVALEIDKYLEDRRSRGAAAIVSEFREILESIRVSEIERRSSDLADLTPDQRERVESLTRSLLAKIAHTPTQALKDAAGTDRGLRLTEALRNLFNLG